MPIRANQELRVFLVFGGALALLFRRGSGGPRQAAFFHPEKRATTSSLSDLHQGTGEGQLGRVRQCYLQIDYAPRRNLGARKPLC